MSQITHTDTIEGRIEAAPPDVMLPPATSEVTRFEIHVPQSALDDLKRRLKATRWPNRETVSDWAQGVPLARMGSLVEYWLASWTAAVISPRSNSPRSS